MNQNERLKVWKDWLVSEGYDQPLSEAEKAWLEALGYPQQLNLAWWLFLKSQGYTGGTMGELMRQFMQDFPPSAITAIVTPALSALDDSQTPASGFSANLASAANYVPTPVEGSAITGVTVVVIWNGVPQTAGVTNQDLLVGDTVQVRVTVTDNQGATKIFLTSIITVDAAVVDDGITFDGDPLTWNGDLLTFIAA